MQEAVMQQQPTRDELIQPPVRAAPANPEPPHHVPRFYRASPGNPVEDLLVYLGLHDSSLIQVGDNAAYPDVAASERTTPHQFAGAHTPPPQPRVLGGLTQRQLAQASAPQQPPFAAGARAATGAAAPQ